MIRNCLLSAMKQWRKATTHRAKGEFTFYLFTKLSSPSPESNEFNESRLSDHKYPCMAQTCLASFQATKRSGQFKLSYNLDQTLLRPRSFQSIRHSRQQILFAKLEHYGICDVALQWFKSYFSCRQQFVRFNQACSPCKPPSMVSFKVRF